MASSDNSKDYTDVGSKEVRPRTHSTSFSKETEHDLYAVTRDEHTPEIEDSATLALPTTDIDELPTSVNLKAVSESSPSSSSFMDGLPVEEQPTWIIPAVQTPKKTTKHKVQDQGEGAQDYKSLIRRLVNTSAIYALSSLTSPLVSLLLAPFLTHHFSRAEYGALAILNTFVILISGVTQLGLGSAFFRAYDYDHESQRDRLDVLSTLFMLLLLITLPTAIIAAVAAPSLAVLLLNTSSFSSAVRISALVVFLQNLSVPGLSWLRAETRAAFFTTVSIINLLVSAGATIFLVGVRHMGIEGALLANGGGYAVIVLSTVPMILLRAGVRLRFDIAREMVLFGFPHTLNLLASWVLQLLDRYLLGLLGSLAQTASYAVGYSLGGALSAIMIAPFSLAWWVLMYSIAKRDDALRVFQLIFRWYGLALLFAAFGLSTFGVIVLDLFFPPSYHSATSVIPIVALSMVLNGVSVVVSIGPSLQRKTWLDTIPLVSSALVNTALNLVLIPYFGAVGAATATLIAYAVLALMGGVINQRIYPVPFEIGRFLIAMLLGIALYAGSGFLAQTQQFYIAWAIRIAALALYGGCLALFAKLPSRGHKHNTSVGVLDSF